MESGTISKLFLPRGFGFIRSGGEEFFFHCSQTQGFDDLATRTSRPIPRSNRTAMAPGVHPTRRHRLFCLS
jgi:hypothetical protein